MGGAWLIGEYLHLHLTFIRSQHLQTVLNNPLIVLVEVVDLIEGADIGDILDYVLVWADNIIIPIHTLLQLPSLLRGGTPHLLKIQQDFYFAFV